jgi:hypothetical protein
MMAGIEKVSIPQLGGNNWSIWKAKFQALLEYKGLMVAVDEPNFVEGRKASGQAKALMILHTEDAFVKLIVGESTAAKAWEKLKQNFEKKSNARVVQLIGKLTNMKLGENQTIAEYLGEFREIKEDLEAAGQTVSDLQLAVHALRGLSKGYKTLREILEAGDFELSLDTIQPKLMQREQTLRLQSENRGKLVDEAQKAAFAARARRNKGSEESFGSPGERSWGSSRFRSSGFERRTCYACKEVGHIKENCRFQNAECHGCGKTRHTKAVCKARQGEKAAFASAANAVAFTTWQGPVNEWPRVWIVDSGSTRHLTPDRDQFSRYKRLVRPERFEGISGETLEVVGVGQVKLQCQTSDGARMVLLREVLHVPQTKASLFALRTPTEAGAEVLIKGRVAQFFMRGRLCMEAIQGDGLWQVVSNGGGKVTPAVKLIREDLPAEGVPAVVEKAPAVIEIDLEDEREEVPSVAQNEKGATQREKAIETELDNRMDAVAVWEQRVHTRAQTRAAEEVEVLEEVKLIEDTGGTGLLLQRGEFQKESRRHQIDMEGVRRMLG